MGRDHDYHHHHNNSPIIGMTTTTTSMSRISSRVSLNGQMSNSHRRFLSMDHFGTLSLSSSPTTSIAIPHHKNHRHHQSQSWNLSSSPPQTLDDGEHPMISSMTRSSELGLDLSQGELGAGLEFGPPGNTYSSRDNLQESPSSSSLLSHKKKAGASRWIPKLMLLTVADEPKKPCEMRVSVSDVSPIESWLKTSNNDPHGSSSLDGVYMQFEPSMITPRGMAALRELSQRYLVGVWGYSGKDPDDYNTFHCLVDQGNVTFVNTDLPSHFRKDIMKRSGTM